MVQVHQGLGVGETPRDVAFCAHAILDDDVFVVPDARPTRGSPTTRSSPATPTSASTPAHPLSTSDGHAVGTLCVIDTEPRDWTPEQSRALRDLANVVEEELNQARLQNQQRALLALTAVTALTEDDQQRAAAPRPRARHASTSACPSASSAGSRETTTRCSSRCPPTGALADGQRFSLAEHLLRAGPRVRRRPRHRAHGNVRVRAGTPATRRSASRATSASPLDRRWPSASARSTSRRRSRAAHRRSARPTSTSCGSWAGGSAATLRALAAQRAAAVAAADRRA